MEQTPLLPAAARSHHFGRTTSTPWALQRLYLVAFMVLSAAATLALVRVSMLSSELLARLKDPRPGIPAHSAQRTTALNTASQYSASQASGAPHPSNDARVLIVYSNGTHLNKLARAVERGVLQVVAQPQQLRTRTVENASFMEDVMWADAVILGSHVVNANVEPKMAAFLSTWALSEDLSRKVGAAFVTGGGISSGEELTMVNLLHSMLIFRMVLVGGERWTSAFGASAIVSEGPFQPTKPTTAQDQEQGFPAICYPTDPDQLHDMFKEKAEGLGRRVASVAELLRTHNV